MIFIKQDTKKYNTGFTPTPIISLFQGVFVHLFQKSSQFFHTSIISQPLSMKQKTPRYDWCRGFTPTPIISLFQGVFVYLFQKSSQLFHTSIISQPLSLKQKTPRYDWCRGFTPTPIVHTLFVKIRTWSTSHFRNNNLRDVRLVSGFTLIELLVATSIFLLTITIGITSLLMMNRTHHITQYKKEQFDALHAVMEDMVRNIRVGTKIRCDVNGSYTTISAGGGDPFDISTPKSCVNTNGDDMPATNTIAFEPIDGIPTDNTDQVGYYIATDPVLNHGVIFKSTDIDFMSNPGTGYSVRVSPDSVAIDLIKSGFTVIHAEDSDLKQPLVLIRLVGTVTYQNNSTPFSLQSAVVQRNPKT